MIKEEIGQLPGYELLDSGYGYRLEKFGEYVLSRPDPGVLWSRGLPDEEWQKADAIFVKRAGDSEEERGGWQKNTAVPEKWQMAYRDIKFFVELSPFKHTGVFPEQVANWDFIVEQVGEWQKKHPGKKMRVLNLFGYTGIASVLCAKLGCEVTHVDASRPSITWAKENMLLSGLPEDAIRWILDDCSKFVKREVKRGGNYDAVIMDPPAFGRGAKGEVWKFSEDLPKLLEDIKQILSDDFGFLIINAYAVSVSSLLLKNLLLGLGKGENIEHGELVLQQKSDGKLLSTGIFARLS